MCTRARPSEGMGGATFVDRVLQMVSEPTLMVVRTGQCGGIGCIARVGLRWDTRVAYGSALDVQSCANRKRSWTFARVSVQT
jgi:hypothetical protein